jgi:hypothetical protein
LSRELPNFSIPRGDTPCVRSSSADQTRWIVDRESAQVALSLVAVAPVWYLPVVAGDHVSARGGTAPAAHPEVCCDSLGCVVDRQLLAGADIAPCRERVRTGVPHVRGAAVVAVVDGLAGWEDQVGIVIDTEGVQVLPAGRGGPQQPVKLRAETNGPARAATVVPAGRGWAANSPCPGWERPGPGRAGAASRRRSCRPDHHRSCLHRAGRPAGCGRGATRRP